MKIILTILRLNIVFLACIFITSCSSLGWLKFWENDEEIEVPALLQDFKQSILIKDLWSAKLGKYEVLGRITPSFSVDEIFYFVENTESEIGLKYSSCISHSVSENIELNLEYSNIK